MLGCAQLQAKHTEGVYKYGLICARRTTSNSIQSISKTSSQFNKTMSSRFPIVLFALLALIALLQLFANAPSAQAQLFGVSDGSASGTILNNLWGRRKRQSFTDGFSSGTILSNLRRKKRQMAFADGMTSGTILNNLWSKKKRQAFADGMTSATILSNLWGRKRRFADGYTSGSILANLY